MNHDLNFPGYSGLKLLWENTNSDAQFTAQTIRVPGVKSYKYLLIGFRGTDGAISSSIVTTNKNETQYVICTEHVLFVERSITVDDDAVTFGNAVVYSIYGQASSIQNNNTVVPLVILGIK